MTSAEQAGELIPAEWAGWVSQLPADGGPDGATWVRGLPRLLAEVLSAWDLLVRGPAMTGWTAIVLPVTRGGERLVVKVIWPHPEAVGEHLALRHWAGQGAVRLTAADPGRGALLLEELDATRDLMDVPMDRACAVIGTILGRLHVPPPPTVRRLSDLADRYAGQLAEAGDLLPRRLTSRATGLLTELADEGPVDVALLHTDLHFENVLAGEREPWLAIDPKPMAGPPGFELQPLLRNRTEEYGTGSSFRWDVRRRLEIAAEAAGIDERDARLWTIVSSTLEALWCADEPEQTSLHIALAKALDD